MDVCKSDFRKHTAVETPRPPLAPAEKNNAPATTRHRTREVSSRYKSFSPSTSSSPSGSRRCPSPNLTRTGPNTSPSGAKRSLSVDRRRPATPPTPPRPSTPVQDSSADMHLAARKASNGRIPEGLWPSTMRSLSVSFQSDSISIPVSKKEKPAPNALSERTLRSSSNVSTPLGGQRKLTPERKRSPLRGKNVADQSENSRPLDGLHTRLIDQHRWPSRVSSNMLSRSVDLGERPARSTATSAPGAGLSSLRRVPLQKSSSDASRHISVEDDGVRLGFGANLATEHTLQASGAYKLVAASLSDRLTPGASVMRSQSLPSGVLRPASPSRTGARGLSPSRARPSTPPPRGASPSRIRPSSANSQPVNSNSVLSFIADFKKGKKGSSYIEDAHQLKLLYNRYLQWRFANARSRRVLYVQKATTERTLFNVWSATLSLWDSVIRKRISLQQMKLELKLNSVLNDQMDYLDEWALLERDHITSLAGAVEDLEASTLRLPVTGGARGDIDSLKAAICSAVDVMHAMASSTCSLLPRVESINSLVSELAVVAARERNKLNECEAELASTAAMQAEEYSLRTHLIQVKEDLGKSSNTRHL